MRCLAGVVRSIPVLIRDHLSAFEVDASCLWLLRESGIPAANMDSYFD